MEFKYFGILPEEEVPKSDVHEIEEYLFQRELFIQYYSFESKFNPVDDQPGEFGLLLNLEGGILSYKCSQELLDNIYNYFKYRYKAYLDYEPVQFEAKFKQITFGLNEEQKKLQAVNSFNMFFHRVQKFNIDSFKDCFEVLSDHQTKMKDQIGDDRELVLAYLTGDHSFFGRSSYESNEMWQDVISFEGYLKIMLFLNNTYILEEDRFFNKENELKAIYPEYEKLFKGFQVYLFVFNTINGFKANMPSQIESLVAALQNKRLLVGSKTTFKKYLKKAHGISLTKIRDYKNILNDKHVKRVSHFEKMLENLNL